MNRVVLVGRLTRDPELRTSGGGNSFVAFTIAVNRAFASSNGEREADFINCIVFNKQAENLNRYIRKGGLVGVDGRLQTRSYTAQDNTRRVVTEVICDNISFLEPKNAQGGARPTNNNDFVDYSPYDMPTQPQQQPRYNNNYQKPTSSATPQKNVANEIQDQFGITDDDLPF